MSIINTSRKSWLTPMISACVTTALGIAVNVATDLTSNWWAWLAVVVLTFAGYAIGLGADQARGPKSTTKAERGLPQGDPSVAVGDKSGQANTGNTGVSIQVGGHGGRITVRTQVGGLTTLALGVVVMLAVLAGLFAGAYLPGESSAGTSVSNVGTSSHPVPSPTGTTSSDGDVQELSCADSVSSARPSNLPFTCAVEQRDNTCGTAGAWLTAKSPDQISEPMPSSAMSYGWREWPAVADGVAASPGRYNLTIQGKTEARVVLTNVVATVVQRREPMKGYELSRDCGGDSVFRTLGVDLDTNPPSISDHFEPEAASDPPGYELKPIKLPYTIALSDPENFMIEGHTVTCDCDWVLELSWASQGKTGRVIINDNGNPFRTSSSVNAKKCTVLERIEC